MRDVPARLVRALLSAWLIVTSVGVGALAAMRAADLGGRVVTTGSMAPTIPADSLVLIGAVDPASIVAGDVISYRRPENRDQLVLHRVVEVLERDDGRYFRTKGDANRLLDAHPVPADDVVGGLRGHLPGVGSLVGWLQPPWGVVFLAGVPLLGLLAGRPRTTRRIDEPPVAPAVETFTSGPRRDRMRTGAAVGLRPAVALAAAAWTLGAASRRGVAPPHRAATKTTRRGPGSRARGGRAHTQTRQGEQR